MEARTICAFFSLDDENLDPKTWCRFPILSGGFSEELKLLHKEVAKNGGEIKSD